MSFYLKIFITLAAIFFAFYLLDIRLLKETLISNNYSNLGLLFFLNITSLVLLALRWLYIMETQYKKNLLRNISVYMSSYIYNFVTPANLGGDFYRAILMKKKYSYPEIIEMLLRERFIGFSSLLFFIIYTSIYIFIDEKISISFWQNIYSPLFILFILFFVISILISKNPSKLTSLFFRISFLKKYQIPEKTIRSFSTTRTLIIFFLSTLSFLIWSLSLWLISKDLNMSITFTEIILISSIVEIIRFMPISIQGIGLREGGFSLMLTFFAYPPEYGFAIALIGYAILTFSQLLFGTLGKAIYLKLDYQEND